MEGIRTIEERVRTRHELFQQILESIFCNKNLDEAYFKNYPRKEVIYCTDVDPQYFIGHLNDLIVSLKGEDFKVKIQFVHELQFLETQQERFLRILEVTLENLKYKRRLSLDEAEIHKLYKMIVKISTKLIIKCKSRKIMRENIHMFQKLVGRFPASHQNLHDRPPSNKYVEVRYITARKLIEKTVEVSDSELAEKLKRLTVFTYDHFISPMSLLLLLIKKYYTPRPLMMTAAEYIEFKQKFSEIRKRRVIEILKFWVNQKPSDYILNSDLLGLLVTFLDSIGKFQGKSCKSESYQQLFSDIEELIKRSKYTDKKALAKVTRRRATKLATLIQGRNYNPRINNIDETNGTGSAKLSRTIPKNSSFNCGRSLYRKVQILSDEELVLSWDTEDVCRQLTLIDQKLFKKVQITQFMMKKWTKSEYSEECKELLAAIRRFNALSFWVQYVIVTAQDWDSRYQLLNKFISIAACCLENQSYSAANSIFTALLKLQLTKIWMISESCDKQWQKLQKVFKSERFFKEMDKEFKNITPPAVPSISFFAKAFFRLQDNVTFQIKLDLPIKQLKGTQLSNLADYCMLIRKFQTVSYNYPKNEKMYTFLKSEFNNKPDIDFYNDEADEILRDKFIALAAKSDGSCKTV